MKRSMVKVAYVTLMIAGLGLSSNLMAASMNSIAKTSSKSIANRTHVSKKGIDINSASVTELTSLKGIGLKRAKAIVSFREKEGVFTSIQDLSKVKGMSENFIKKLVKNNQGKIVVNPKS